MKKIFLLFCFLIYGTVTYGINLPIFNMPPNNYKLFTHKIITNSTEQHKSYRTLNANNISVSGIFQSQGKYYVLINHKVCKKGDEIDGYTIERIENDKVIFMKDGVESTKTISSEQGAVFFNNDTISNDNSSNH